MQISSCSKSKSFFELFQEIDHKTFYEVSGTRKRLFALKIFCRLLFFIPLGLLYKAYKTTFRFFGVVWSTSLVLLTFGSLNASRDYFLDRMIAFAKDLGDWFLYPFAVILALFRLFLIFFISPSLFFNF